MALRMKTWTEYDFAHMKELQQVVSRKITASASRKERIGGVLWGIVGLTASVLIVTQTQWWTVGLLFGAMSLFLLGRFGLFYCSYMAAVACRGVDPSAVRTDYVLEKSYLLASNAKGSAQYPYSACFRLLETEGNLYYISKEGQGVILDKANLAGGSVDELRAWMEEKCGKPLEWAGKPQK